MKSLRLLSLAALLTTGLAAGSMAAGQDSSAGGPEASGSKQQNTPATGSAAPTNQRMSNGGVAGLSAQTPGNGKNILGSSARPVRRSRMQPIRTAQRPTAAAAVATEPIRPNFGPGGVPRPRQQD